MKSRSPVRASIEVTCPACWVVETEDGEKYGFTNAEVLKKFGNRGAFQIALDDRKARIQAAGNGSISA